MTTHSPVAKALTVRQPWAWAIVHGGKDVENRSRRTSYRGPVLIHAGGTPAKLDEYLRRDSPMVAALCAAQPGAPVGVAVINAHFLPRGAILGVVDVVGCHQDNSEECNGRLHLGTCSAWALGGQWHWQLANPRPLDEPIPCTGARGLWTPAADVLASVQDSLRAAAARVTPSPETAHGVVVQGTSEDSRGGVA